MRTILFVCTGNTCRSIMAEALFKDMLGKKKDKFRNIKVISAGTCAWEGDGASPQAVEVLREKGIDITDHSSTPLTPKLIKDSDLILTMTLNHKQAVLYMRPEAKEKTYTLKEYALDYSNEKLQNIEFEEINYDIKDPYGQSVNVYRESAEEIEKYLKILIEKESFI